MLPNSKRPSSRILVATVVVAALAVTAVWTGCRGGGPAGLGSDGRIDTTRLAGPNMSPARKIDPALRRAIPPIDAKAPAGVQTATFALG